MSSSSTSDKSGQTSAYSNHKFSQFSPLRNIDSSDYFDDLKIDDEESDSECSDYEDQDDLDFIERDEIAPFGKKIDNIIINCNIFGNVDSTDFEELDLSPASKLPRERATRVIPSMKSMNVKVNELMR